MIENHLIGTPTVFVVDDDPSLRVALPRLLSSVGLRSEIFATAEEFRLQVDPSRAGCLVLDVRMPGTSGLDLQEQLSAAGYELPVIFLTAHADVSLTVRAMKAGALELFTKPFDDQQLLDAVHEALERDRVHRLRLADLRLLRDRYERLTGRERDVMTRVVMGRLNKQIASDLGISEKTVKGHRGQVMRKMQAASLADLVRMADRIARMTPPPGVSEG
jgi:FixJ family two-component response regulator